jgi:hypothetical protein
MEIRKEAVYSVIDVVEQYRDGYKDGYQEGFLDGLGTHNKKDEKIDVH